MISIVKGKTEISRNLQTVLKPFLPQPRKKAEVQEYSENGLFNQAHRRNAFVLERLAKPL